MSKTVEVYKSNALMEASYRLTPSEQGIILSCISQIRKDENVTDQTMYTVSVSEYVALTNADPISAYRDIKAAAIRLRNREVRIYNPPNVRGGRQKKNRTLVAGWVQSISYQDKEGVVELRFNHDMLPYLTNLSKNFTKYAFKHVAKMSSSYGIRLYEILIQWIGEGKEENEVSVEWLKKTFQLESKYKVMKDFKKYVLQPAIADIKKHSDLRIEWDQRKTGRRITHLTFKFSLKSKKTKQERTELTFQGVRKSIIDQKAKPGESYEQAARRIKASAHQKQKNKNETA